MPARQVGLTQLLSKLIRKLFNLSSRGKSRYDPLPCEQFLKQIEISRTFLHAKKMGKSARDFNLL